MKLKNSLILASFDISGLQRASVGDWLELAEDMHDDVACTPKRYNRLGLGTPALGVGEQR